MLRSHLTRRRVLASLGAGPVATVAATSVHALAASQEREPFDPAPQTESVFTARLHIKLNSTPAATVGSAAILGGEAEGGLAGAVQPGSLEWTCDPVRGVLQLALRFELQISPNLRIHVADCATVVTPSAERWEVPFSTTPELTVVDGSPAACRESVYLGRMDARQIHAGVLRLSVHRVL
jgi:hypothetical protein